jgi:hypothetical protein
MRCVVSEFRKNRSKKTRKMYQERRGTREYRRRTQRKERNHGNILTASWRVETDGLEDVTRR